MTRKINKDNKNRYGKDFLTGCLAIILISIAIFILIPILIFMLKLSFIIVIPIVAVLSIIIFTIFFGHIINTIITVFRKKDEDSTATENDEIETGKNKDNTC